MSPREPLFAGLVYNQEGQPVQTAHVGDEILYAIPDGDFLRHVEAAEVDRQILARIKAHLLSMKDAVVEGAMQLMGSDDPFTRAAIEMSLESLDRLLEAGAEMGRVEDLRLGMWMAGLRAVVDVHGEVTHVELPGVEEPP